MSRLQATFDRLRTTARPGLVIYVTAGDPDIETSGQILKAIARAGADVIEVGVPFSDPIADGPVIQRASERALAAGGGLGPTLDLLERLRPATGPPIVLFTYVNPVWRMGLEPFAARAAAVGVDGVLLLDLPIEEADEARTVLDRHGLDLIFLVSPTTSAARLRRAGQLGRGFVYAISRLGVTGMRDRLPESAAPLVGRAREATGLPIALGFGISTPCQVAEVTRFADAAVVGSAVVQVVADAAAAGEDVAGSVERFVGSLRGAMT
ncbi:MAG TPA: tryptophan synthase subunit alpha [Vicinamibacterales bacterium]|nr:tryptophan synthase subunit alpha [Vicinamibacterales bacterium]